MVTRGWIQINSYRVPRCRVPAHSLSIAFVKGWIADSGTVRGHKRVCREEEGTDAEREWLEMEGRAASSSSCS